MAIDVGMYVSQVFLNEFPHLRWEQSLHDKQSIDYGQPVLTGLGPVPFNPVQIMVTLAYGLVSGRNKGGRLREIFDYWTKSA